MGKKSTKEDKNIYFTSRENVGMTRDVASEKMEFIGKDRLFRIENDETVPHPEEILAMANAYKNPSLCNYFCANECPIGKEYVPEITSKELAQITLEMLSTINTLSKEKDRLVEITVDGKITEDEYEDFKKIQEDLSEMALAIDSLKLWVQNAIASGSQEAFLLDK